MSRATTHTVSRHYLHYNQDACPTQEQYNNLEIPLLWESRFLSSYDHHAARTISQMYCSPVHY